MAAIATTANIIYHRESKIKLKNLLNIIKIEMSFFVLHSKFEKMNTTNNTNHMSKKMSSTLNKLFPLKERSLIFNFLINNQPLLEGGRGWGWGAHDEVYPMIV